MKVRTRTRVLDEAITNTANEAALLLAFDFMKDDQHECGEALKTLWQSDMTH